MRFVCFSRFSEDVVRTKETFVSFAVAATIATDAFRAAMAEHRRDWTAATIGELIDRGWVTRRDGHGSQSKDQRSGEVPYITLDAYDLAADEARHCGSMMNAGMNGVITDRVTDREDAVA